MPPVSTDRTSTPLAARTSVSQSATSALCRIQSEVRGRRPWNAMVEPQVSSTILSRSSCGSSTPTAFCALVPNAAKPPVRWVPKVGPFSRTRTLAPISAAFMAAGVPEIPAPTTTTSQATVSAMAESGMGSGAISKERVPGLRRAHATLPSISA